MSDFDNVSFIYQKALTYIEVAVMVFTILLGAIDLVPMAYQSSTVLLFYQVIFWLSAATGNSCTYLVLVIVIKRFIALWLPSWFGTVNRKPIILAGIVLAIFMGCEAVTSEFETSGTFFDSTSSTNKLTTYVWVKDIVYQNWLTFRNASLLAAGYALTVVSILVAIGFSKLSKSKHMVNDISDSDKIFKLNKQLSILSLICSVPLGIYVTLQTVYDQYLGKYTVGIGAVTSLSYSDAMYYVLKGKCAVVVRTLQTVVFLFAHSFNFYFYFVWCPRFHNSTLSYLYSRKYNIFSSTSKSTTMVKSIK